MLIPQELQLSPSHSILPSLQNTDKILIHKAEKRFMIHYAANITLYK